LADSFRSREKRSSALVGIMKHGNMQLWKRPGTMSGRSSFRFTISCQPAQILEIAPGFGRWTHYLKDYCENLWIVDRSSECIEACRQRFAADSRVRCYLNDGRSLAMVPDASIDFVFSFDSFVHTSRDVVDAYLRELGRKLKLGGKGFIHHSNFGEYVNTPRERLPEALAKPLIKARILDWAHNRNPGMSADLFRVLCAQHGL